MAQLVGHQIRILDLHSRPELNGCVGIAESFVPDSGRVVVSLPSGEMVALRPLNCTLASGSDTRRNYETGNSSRAPGAGITFDAKWVALVAVALIFVVGFPMLPTLFAVGIGFLVYSARRNPRQFQAAINRTTLEVQCRTGLALSPVQLGLAVLLLAAAVYMLFMRQSQSYSYHGDPYQSSFGGGIDFFWLLGAFFLGSTVWRMGGGGSPSGWSLDQLWNSLSNMDIWRAMMLLNLLRQVFGGQRRGGFGRRRYY